MPDARTVYVDFEGFNGGNLEALGRHLTDAALKETTNWDLSDLKSDPTKMVALMRQWAKSDPCVFLIDELPYSKYLAYQFLSAVRNYYITCLLSEPNEIHQFVITGSLDLGHLSRDVNPEVSPFNIAVEEYLEDFSQEDIVKFIRHKADFRKTRYERWPSIRMGTRS
jgi:hypothetical protein